MFYVTSVMLFAAHRIKRGTYQTLVHFYFLLPGHPWELVQSENDEQVLRLRSCLVKNNKLVSRTVVN